MYIENYHRLNPTPEKKSRKGKIFLGLILILAVGGIFWWLDRPEEKVPEQEGEVKAAEVVKNPKEDERLVEHQVAEGDLPADIFSTHGKWDANDTEALLKAGKEVYDLSNLKLGKNIRFYFGEEERASRMEYDRDTERVIVARRNGDAFEVQEEKIEYEVSQVAARGTIDNFLYVDALEAGLSEPTVLEIGDIFAFDVDFTTEIQKGDSFAVVYEKRKRAGQDGPDGLVLAAKFVNEGKAYYAYYFDNDGQGGFYDADGRVLERQFLKAPLSYRRITSGFTGARYHPITRTVSAHYQIDYAAATGTPVVSTARGTVVSAGWENGWGNMIRLRHDNGYTTHYGHLSAFAKGLKNGASVSQGQVIGYVGSTGWSTGPHLDFGMKLDGSPINPLKLQSPKGAPLDGAKMEEFNQWKNSFAERLN